MSVLNHFLRGAALSGVLAGSAMAQDADVRLTQDEWETITILRNFNECVAQAEDTVTQRAYDAAYTEAYLQHRANREQYRIDVEEPYYAALREYKDDAGYTDRLARLHERMTEMSDRYLALAPDQRSLWPEMTTYNAYQAQYDMLNDAAEEAFNAITTLTIPEVPEMPEVVVYDPNTSIAHCSAAMNDDIKSVYGEAAGVGSDYLASYQFGINVKAVQLQVSPQTFLNLTRAP